MNGLIEDAFGAVCDAFDELQEAMKDAGSAAVPSLLGNLAERCDHMASVWSWEGGAESAEQWTAAVDRAIERGAGGGRGASPSGPRPWSK